MVAVALWRQERRVETYSDAVRPLVRAVGERRFFEPRLTGGFEFGPPISAKRSPGSAADSTTWEVLAVAGELRGRSGATSLAARGARGAAALFLGDVNAAVAIYSQLLHDDPRSAEWHSNLAAALLVRGASEVGSPDQRGKDAEEALRHADEALRMNPALNEARFNRGLALRTLGRAEEARHSFAELERQSGSWSKAARDHLRDLEEVSGRRP